ncbi:MAG: hypothetical protein OXC03_06465 [Flavobacteriaceae bacterium]|nr:hypothetical protein [Flavobacteriaceae bacterium]
MSDKPLKFSQLEKKVSQLLNVYQQQSQHIYRLNEENKLLVKENESLKGKLETLQKNYQTSNDVSLRLGSEVDASSFKIQIGQLVEKVDRCIEDFSKITYQTVA